MPKIGSPIQFQSAMSPLLKFTSGVALKKVWKRKAGSPTSKPDWPPSPIIVFSHLVGLPGVCHVPLSCVPPCSTLTLNGLTERLWNCSVDSPLFMPVSLLGTRDSSCLQRASCAGLTRPRWSQTTTTRR